MAEEEQAVDHREEALRALKRSPPLRASDGPAIEQERRVAVAHVHATLAVADELKRLSEALGSVIEVPRGVVRTRDA